MKVSWVDASPIGRRVRVNLARLLKWQIRVVGALMLTATFMMQLPVAAGSAGAQGVSTFAITNAHVLPMTGNTVLNAHTVIVREGRVAWVGPDDEAEVPGDAIRIDAAGRYLLPGLTDMHVHVGPESDPLFIANGVTAVRRMHGNDEALEWRGANRQSGTDGPTVFVAGPLLAGEPTPWGHEQRPESPAAAAELVARHAEAGYDFIKIYDDLSRELYEAITAAASQHGLRTVGHLPVDVGIQGVLDGDQSTVEHVEQLLFAWFGRDGSDVRFVGVELADGAFVTAPANRLDEIVEQMAGNDVFVTPSLAAMARIMSRGTPWYEEQFELPSMRFTQTFWSTWWEAGRNKDFVQATHDRHRQFLELQRQLTLQLHQAGVRLLAGTDTAAPLTPPGFSLHDEIDELHTVGLSRYEALEAATAHAGEALGQPGERGVIATGAIADMMLVETNPLTDLATLRDPSGVVLRGRWLDREYLQRLLTAADPANGPAH